jgi:hypothetical protein
MPRAKIAATKGIFPAGARPENQKLLSRLLTTTMPWWTWNVVLLSLLGFGWTSGIQGEKPGESMLSPHTSPSPVTMEEDWWPREGSYLVVFISTECRHCREAVPQLNTYAKAKGLPPLHAVCYNQPWEMNIFQVEYGPKFPLHQMGWGNFMQRLGNYSTPALKWLYHGQVRWETGPPLPPLPELRRQLREAQRQPATRKASFHQ